MTLVITPKSPETLLTKIIKFIFYAIMIIFGGSYALVYFHGNKGFSEEDISVAEKSIKSKYEENSGVKVTAVSLIKTEKRKLVGFVKMTQDTVQFSKNCEANMGENNKDYIWSCK
jgi:hypothetical protein